MSRNSENSKIDENPNSKIPHFQQTFRPRKVSSNFKKKNRKMLNWCQKNFIFRGLKKIKYLSDLNEKFLIREDNCCRFGPVWTLFERVQFPSVSGNIRYLEISSEFKKFLKILKMASEKLYFQRILYGRIFVEFIWKVDSEKVQILYFSTCFTVFS